MSWPVAFAANPPVIAFEPLLLASALEIGPELRLIDGMSPLLASGPGGIYCVLMPMRCADAAVIAAHASEEENQQTVPAAVAAAA